MSYTKGDLAELSQFANELQRKTEKETKAAEKRRGEQIRQQLAPLRAKLTKLLPELEKLRPDALQARQACLIILGSGVKLLPNQRSALDGLINDLAGPAGPGAAKAVEDRIAEIDGIGDDDLRYISLMNSRAAGPLANLGTAKENIEKALSFKRQLGPAAQVHAVREVEEPALEDETEHNPGEGLRVITNLRT